MAPLLKPAVRMLCAVAVAVGVTACGTTVSTGSFKGEQREVAQAISSLQTDVKAADALADLVRRAHEDKSNP